MPNPEPYDLKEKVRHLPHLPGVYLMKDRFGQIIYVGKAKNLKKRVSTYFQASRNTLHHPKIRALVQSIADFETIEVKSEPEALLLEGRLIKEWKPRYNTDFTDDKRFLLVRVNLQDKIPAFRLVRNRLEDNALYFGPFAHSGLLRKTLVEIRRRFGVVLGDTYPREIKPGVFILYDDIRGEIYGHPNQVNQDDYRQRVEQACDFLDGKAREWLANLRTEMMQCAEQRNYEKAADLRDLILALEKTTSPTRKFTRGPIVPRQDEQTAVTALQQLLNMQAPPAHIECFDISHISGTFVVASMVHFSDGKADKKRYRRYQIRSFIGNDDFRAMEEVVSRRYLRLHREQQTFPDLIVIDGGKGQVGAALRAFAIHDLPTPTLIGLAKSEETIIFSDGREPLIPSRQDAGLRLLQRIRDESHRVANSYNADLRSRKLRESILDEFKGLGPSRKQALYKHFGSLDRLRKASLEDLQAIPGIGPKLAANLHQFLANINEKK